MAKNTPQEEKNLNIVKRFFNEVLKTGNTNLVDEFAATNLTYTRNGILMDKVGPDVLKERINFIWESYDFKTRILESIAQEDKVVIRYIFRGKHKKSGNQVGSFGVHIYHIEKGKIVHAREIYDALTVYKQLGYTLTPPAWAKEK
jgi:ketosteroid isomerase-like protein